MAMQFERLFTPIKLRNRTVKNRIVMPCHGTRMPFFADELADPDQYMEYLKARAKGGCGMIIMGSVHGHRANARMGLLVPPTPEILAPKLKRMADAMHEYGTTLLLQVWHRGNTGDSTENMYPLFGFTPRPSPDSPRREVCHEMDDDEIYDAIKGYTSMAVLAKENGVDGVELHGTHGSLLQQSWTNWANQRTDKWGKQMAFANELINRTRAAVGNDFIVGMRISSDDLYPGGMDNEAMRSVARALDETGKLDFIALSVGSHSGHYAWSMGNMYVPPGAFVPLASGIREAVKSTNIVAGNRINDPALAENVLAEGHADMISMCRALIVDPEFANKAREGRVDDIRLCIACNQGCIERLLGRMTITCLQNAVVSKEKKIGVITPAPKKKKVVVIGGGPGGMEAARVAALRGHDVTLYEKEPQLGGQINTLAKAPGREEFSQATRYLAAQLNKLKVKVKLGTEATLETIKQEKPDTVIVATGSKPYVAPIPGSDQPNVFTPSQVLDGKANVGERVVVYDDTGLQEGYSVADFLTDQGKKVDIVTPLFRAAANSGYTYLPSIMPRLAKKGVDFMAFTLLKRISGKTLMVQNVYSEEERTIDSVDSVVLATGYRANDSLYRALKGQVGELYVVGDSFSPKRAIDAIHDAYNTAFKI